MTSPLQEFEVTMRFWMTDENVARAMAEAIRTGMKAMQPLAAPAIGDRPEPEIRLAKILEIPG